MSDKDVIKEAQEAFQEVEEAESENRRLGREDVRFGRLDDQWTDQERRDRDLDGRPCLTINKLPASMRQVYNDARQNRPAIVVHPVDGGADRGLSFMPVDVIRLLDSDLFALSTGDEFKAALALWCKSWTQIPGGSLPADDRVLAHLSGAGSKWSKVKAMALRGWALAADGRLYHPVVAEKVIEAWDRRGEWQERQNAKAERQRRWRERVKFVSAQLRAAGVTVPQGASLETLERLAQENDVDVSRDTEASTDASTGPSTRDAHETLIDRDSGQRTADRGQGTGTNLIGGEPRKRGHRLPEDWSLTPELLAFGVGKGLTDRGVRDSAERFANHWGAATGRNATKLDWDKAFKVWVGNDANDPRHRRAQAPRSPGVW